MPSKENDEHWFNDVEELIKIPEPSLNDTKNSFKIGCVSHS